ncbi:MAG: hypothetical protein GX649_06005 [Chloroflexi bacterium]|nr:hypothetical protein [Chloroflexota bacterium]
MGDTTEATVRDAATIDVECEACGHQFSYEQIFLAKAEVRYADPRADAIRTVKRLGEELRSGFGKNDFGRLSWKRCPNCGYTQSWMTKRARISQGLRLFLPPTLLLFFGGLAAAILIPDPAVGGQVLKYSLFGALAMPIIGVVSMILAFQPNRGRGEVSKFNKPNITFEVEKASAQGQQMQVQNMPGDIRDAL